MCKRTYSLRPGVRVLALAEALALCGGSVAGRFGEQ
jgi:hypothetical protein